MIGHEWLHLPSGIEVQVAPGVFIMQITNDEMPISVRRTGVLGVAGRAPAIPRTIRDHALAEHSITTSVDDAVHCSCGESWTERG